MIELSDGALFIRIKAVPGASKDQIAGVLDMPGGERLKVRISAPPEGGKANKAVCNLIARTIGARAKQVSIEAGTTSAEKTVRVDGPLPAAGLDELRARLLGP